MTADHETMTAEEIEALKIWAPYWSDADCRKALATIARLESALAVAREALSALSSQVQAHVCAIDNMDADEFCEKQLVDAEAAIDTIDAALKGAHPAEGEECVAVPRELLEQAHAAMRETGWHLATADIRSDDGVIEAAITEIEDKFAALLAPAQGGENVG